jgi:hypothetical protein
LKPRRAWALLFVASAGLAATTSWAQGFGEVPSALEAEQLPSVYTIDSEPIRVTAVLRGRTAFQGELPLTIPGDLTGEYLLDLTAPGYAAQRTRIVFPGSFGGSPELRAPRSAEPGTLAKSLIWPGLAELTGDEGDAYRGRGFALAGIAGVGGLLATEISRRSSEDDAEEAARRHIEERDLIEATRQALIAADEAGTARAAEDARWDWAILAAAAWGISLVDTYFLTPQNEPADVEFTDLTFRLRPLSRTQAFLRSLVPGLGQYYAGRKGAGKLAFYGALGAVTGLLVTEYSYKEAVEQLKATEALYSDPLADPEEVAIYRAAAVERAESADDKKTRRNVMIGVTAGVWAVNLLDALVSTPGPGKAAGRAEVGDRPAAPSFGVSGRLVAGGPGLAASLSF